MMNVKVERLDHNEALITVEVEYSQFDAAINKVYNNKKGSISIQGFRKGKAPRKIIEKMYGEGVFYEDAANQVIRETYEEALDESKLDVVSRPQIDIEKIEKDAPFVYSAKVAVKPEVKLGEYKGVEVEAVAVEVTDEEVESNINAELEKNARVVSVTDRELQDKDQAIIDFEGRIDGELFQGGQAEEFPLIIGSKTFIDGFEEQLIGMNAGEEKVVNVTFPENYNVQELAGKPAEFKVTLKEIKVKEVPTLDMEFVEEVSEAESVEAYKEEVRNGLLTKKKEEAKTKQENQAVQKVIDATEIDLSELMILSTAEEMMSDFAQRLRQQGLEMDQYLQFTNQTRDKLVEQLKEQGEKRIRTRLTLEAVVAAENIKATDEEMDAKLSELAEQYKMDKEELSKMIPEREKEALNLDIAVQKAIDFIIDNANIK